MADPIALIDYGAGNLHSVHNALKAAGAERVAVTADPAIVRGARRIVLPGVGSLKACAHGLEGIPGPGVAMEERGGGGGASAGAGGLARAGFCGRGAGRNTVPPPGPAESRDRSSRSSEPTRT